MYSICKEFSFEYSHKLNMDYKSDCKNLHGHSARILIHIWSKELNDNGMILDFVHFRDFKQILDDNFDHAVILNGNDSFIEYASNNNLKHFILEKGLDPTSEVMSKVIWTLCKQFLNKLNIPWDKMEVQFYETAKNYASYQDKYSS